MCRIDDGDYCDIWNVTMPRAKKSHQCTECGRVIDAGERYRRVDSLYDRVWSTDRVCQHCNVGAEWLEKECGGYLQGGILEEIYEHAQEYRIASLWKIVVGSNRKWRRFDGASLMHMPKMPILKQVAT